jgi:uncharacterized protein YigE (DUF2233 family)
MVVARTLGTAAKMRSMGHSGRSLLGCCAVAMVVLTARSVQADELKWRTLQPGVEYAVARGPREDEAIHVVRIDPDKAKLVAVMAAEEDRKARTAGTWCRERKLAVAINLGMYRDDHLTNVGHAHTSRHANNAKWSKKYNTVLAFEPLKKEIAAARLLDLDAADTKVQLADYGAAVQNLRLIRAPGRNVWGKQERRWSEAAVAIDKDGRILFLFSRHPYSMAEFNNKVLALPLAITNAMHVEGGPEASLSIHAGGVDLDSNGSYETGFNENDDEKRQWPIPNVLGVPRE